MAMDLLAYSKMGRNRRSIEALMARVDELEARVRLLEARERGASR